MKERIKGTISTGPMKAPESMPIGKALALAGNRGIVGTTFGAPSVIYSWPTEGWRIIRLGDYIVIGRGSTLNAVHVSDIMPNSALAQKLSAHGIDWAT